MTIAKEADDILRDTYECFMVACEQWMLATYGDFDDCEKRVAFFANERVRRKAQEEFRALVAYDGATVH